MKTLFSFIIAFAFVTTLFGQEARTSPVISSSSKDPRQDNPKEKEKKEWRLIKIDQKKITLDIRKSDGCDCAILKNITATDENDSPVAISFLKAELAKPKSGIDQAISITFDENFSDKKIKFVFDWNTDKCTGGGTTLSKSSTLKTNAKGEDAGKMIISQQDIWHYRIKNKVIKVETATKGTEKN